MENEPLETTATFASTLDLLKASVIEIKSVIDDLEESKERAKHNYSLTSLERSLLVSAVNVKLVYAERDLNRMNAKLATQELRFKKETFWRSF